MLATVTLVFILSGCAIYCFLYCTCTQVFGLDILSLQRGYVAQHIAPELQRALEANRINFDKNWSAVTSYEFINYLRDVEGLPALDADALQCVLDAGYVLTLDTVLKMLAMQVAHNYHYLYYCYMLQQLSY
jgi:hypothetical protein